MSVCGREPIAPARQVTAEPIAPARQVTAALPRAGEGQADR